MFKSALIMPPIRTKRVPELDCLTRAKICVLHATNDWGATTIKKIRIHDIPRSTIQYTLTQEAKRQKHQCLPRSGAPKKLTEDDRDHIYETIQEKPSVLIEDLLARSISRSTLCQFGAEPTKWAFGSGERCRSLRRLAFLFTFAHSDAWLKCWQSAEQNGHW
jgi:hypothetical protein